MSSESLIQGLHEECKAAQAQAAAWEEIALANPCVEYGWDDAAKSYAYFIYDDPLTEQPRLIAKGETRRAALLAWHANRKDG